MDQLGGSLFAGGVGAIFFLQGLSHLVQNASFSPPYQVDSLYTHGKVAHRLGTLRCGNYSIDTVDRRPLDGGEQWCGSNHD